MKPWYLVFVLTKKAIYAIKDTPTNELRKQNLGNVELTKSSSLPCVDL